MSETERRLREDEVADRDRLSESRRDAVRNDATDWVGGLEWNDGEREWLGRSDEAVKIHCAAPACLTAVPREFHDDRESVRGSESELEPGPRGRKLTLELSRVTKLGLDGAPMGWILGLEYPNVDASSGSDFGDVGGSDTTALIVGVAVGSTIKSSSENSASDPSELKSSGLAEGKSGKEDLLDVGSSSHISGGELPGSTVDVSHSPTDCSRTLLSVPWLNVGDQVDDEGPAVAYLRPVSAIYCCWPLPGIGSKICSGFVGNGVAIYISFTSSCVRTLCRDRVGDLSLV